MHEVSKATSNVVMVATSYTKSKKGVTISRFIEEIKKRYFSSARHQYMTNETLQAITKGSKKILKNVIPTQESQKRDKMSDFV